MFNPVTVITAFCLYMGGLFCIAARVEKRFVDQDRPRTNAAIYSLSLAVYCTTWTFYGSVGQAAISPLHYLSIYIGPTLSMLVAWWLLRKMVRIKSAYRITNIADFVSCRYNHSRLLAAITTAFAILGIGPYIALQLKAVTATFAIITRGSGALQVGPIVVVLMVLFTTIFGVRRLDPTERHPGMMAAMAIESVIKLVAFLAVGIFITYFVYDGFDDIFQRVADQGIFQAGSSPWTGGDFITWGTYILLAMSAILFLPRQFHVAVVENGDEGHIRTAMWLFPLYLFLINIFVLPVAMGGLLMGFPQSVADSFVLSIPFHYQRVWLCLLVFIGGFSAATGMIMVSSMTMSTMVVNHLLLPVVEWAQPLGFLRRRLLLCRWIAVAGIITLGYALERILGESYMLLNMGVISFAAVLQIVPAMVGGLFWPHGNRIGAIWGLSSGFMVWVYTLFVPAFIKSGWGSMAILEKGAWGLAWLRPEQLFGLNVLDPVPHTVFWSMVLNIGAYLAGSLFFRQHPAEQQVALDFARIFDRQGDRSQMESKAAWIDLGDKTRRVETFLGRYFDDDTAADLVRRALAAVGLGGRETVSIVEVTRFYAHVEKVLSGTIGSATAHASMKREGLFSPEEYQELSSVYAELLVELNLTPEELKAKIDYHQEREDLFRRHAGELEASVAEKEREIAQRRLTEAALKKSEEKYRSLLEAAPDPIVVYDTDGRVAHINRAFTRVFGWRLDEWLGKKMDDYVPPDALPDSQAAMDEAIAEEGPTRFETQRLTKDGRLVDVSIGAAPYRDADGRIVGMVALLSDITDRVRAAHERSRLEIMLRQSQKMEAIGTLAGGIAHDFNNILSAILGYAELSQMKVDKDSRIRGYLDHIQQAGNRARELIQQILTFSRQSEQEIKPIKAGPIAKEVLKLLRASLPTTIDIVQRIETRAPILGDPVQMHQILMNLCTNAAHAMQMSGGTLTVTLEDTHLGTADAPALQGLNPGLYLKTVVSDTGCGMPTEISERIFEPFFTTKPKGEGTGMGLAVVHGIVNRQGGRIQVSSAPGEGSAITVWLPALENDSPVEVQDQRALPSGNERILFVDDEPHIVAIGKEMLESLGYSVSAHTRSTEALSVLKHQSAHFDLVITDMTMPKMTGDELARSVLALRPDLPVIICTGFSTRITEQSALDMGVRALIMKPFVISDLAETVRQVLDNRKTT